MELPGQGDGDAGDNVSITVKLIAPIAMEEGLRFAIREGGRKLSAQASGQDHRVEKKPRSRRTMSEAEDPHPPLFERPSIRIRSKAFDY